MTINEIKGKFPQVETVIKLWPILLALIGGIYSVGYTMSSQVNTATQDRNYSQATRENLNTYEKRTDDKLEKTTNTLNDINEKMAAVQEGQDWVKRFLVKHVQ